MKVREALQSDTSEWSRMRTLLWPDTEDNHLSEIADFFAGDSHDIAQTYVVDNNGKGLVGFIELNIRNFVEGSRNDAVPYIEGWYVDTDYQAQGLGKKLLERAEKWAKDRGFTELASDAEMDNTRSIAIHEHLGFAETYRVVCFLKKIK
ncbi:MAG: GNAT family N-acetyltransferase [Gammaproteobacteria bacterium]